MQIIMHAKNTSIRITIYRRHALNSLTSSLNIFIHYDTDNYISGTYTHKHNMKTQADVSIINTDCTSDFIRNLRISQSSTLYYQCQFGDELKTKFQSL